MNENFTKKFLTEFPRTKKYETQPEYRSWEPCQKKSGKITTEIKRTEQAVVWTELLLWKGSGQ